MREPIGTFRKYGGGRSGGFAGCLTGCLVLAAVVSLAGCATGLAMAQAPEASPASAISAITLEQGCSGCPTGSLLAVRRDGTATLTIRGNARFGTQGTIATGTVQARDFDALARLIVSKGFFALNDSYEDPQTRDGAWTITSVTRSGVDKRVFRRDEAGPEALAAIESAMTALQARIGFAAKQ